VVTAGRDMNEASAFSQETGDRVLPLELDITNLSMLPKPSKAQGDRGVRGAERREDVQARKLGRRGGPR
jgi:hypothetical protein